MTNAIIYDEVIRMVEKNIQMISIIVGSDRSDKQKAEVVYTMIKAFESDAKGRLDDKKTF